MSDVQVIDLDKERRRPTKLIYIGNEPRPYGINEVDTWAMDNHLAVVMANGLRMLVAYGHGVRDEAQYELIASKLEFYGNDATDTMFQYVDFSNDDERELGSEGWLSFDGQPGFQEYCEKSKIIDQMRHIYMREAMEWLTKNWSQLWD